MSVPPPCAGCRLRDGPNLPYTQKKGRPTAALLIKPKQRTIQKPNDHAISFAPAACSNSSKITCSGAGVSKLTTTITARPTKNAGSSS